MEDPINLYIIAIGVLIMISALFSSGETSITAASKARIHRLANEGNRRAKKIEKLLKHRERVLGAMLVGNNLVNILASVLATNVLVKSFGEAGMIYATGIMTVLVVVFTEITPKTFAIKVPNRIVLFLSPLLVVATTIFHPFVYFVQKGINYLADLFLVKPKQDSKREELNEIREAVDLKHKEGSIFKYDKDLLDGVLDLSDTEIGEIMVHRKDIESINIDLQTSQIIKEALNISYNRIPMWKDNKENIVAILNVRKLLKAIQYFRAKDGFDVDKFDIKSVTSEPWFVPVTNSLRVQLFACRRLKKRFALVIDEYGALLGLITLEDILEEIVGDIEEQDDDKEVKIFKLKSGACKIAGNSLVRDINKILGWDISDSEYAHNLAAYIINALGRVPQEKEKFVIDGYEFEILRKRNQDLVMVKVKKGTKDIDLAILPKASNSKVNL